MNEARQLNVYVNPYTIYQIDVGNNKLNIVEVSGETFKDFKQEIIKSYDLNTIIKVVDEILKEDNKEENE